MGNTAWIIAGLGVLGMLQGAGLNAAWACAGANVTQRPVVIERGDASGFVTLQGGEKVALASLDRESQRLPAIDGRAAIVSIFGVDRHGALVADLLIEGISLRGELLKKGAARLRPGLSPDPCIAELRALEAGARLAGLGLWGQTQYGIINASNADSVRKAAGRFIIAQGTVVHVGVRNKRVYLDFGNEIGRSPAAILDRHSIERQTGGDARALIGRWVEVRGVVAIGDPPRIDVDSAASVAVLPGLENVRRSP